jgi:hypothetical protein
MGTNASRLGPLLVAACAGTTLSIPTHATAQAIVCCNIVVDVGGDWIGQGKCEDLSHVSPEMRERACQRLTRCPPAQPYCRACSEPWPPGCPCAAGEVHNYQTGACMPDPCAGRPGVMHWPTNNRCVPESCDQPDTGRNLVRDAQGNCVPRTGSCDEPGARRNPNGVCVPSPGRASGPEAGRPGGSAGATDWSKNPVVKDFLEDCDMARKIWDTYYPGKGYGPYQVEYPPSGGTSVCQENPEGPICTSAADAPNPIGPDSGCTHDGSQWRCVEVPNSP